MKKRFSKGIAVVIAITAAVSSISVYAGEIVPDDADQEIVMAVEEHQDSVSDEEPSAHVSKYTEGDYVYDLDEDDNCTIVKYKGTASVVNIPEKINGHPVREIGFAAFRQNESITEITFPAGLEKIDSENFHDCINLRKVVIPDSVKAIGYSAFHGCSSLSDINLPANLNYICSNTFQECKSLTKISIPDGVTVIGESAFDNCTSLSEVKLSKNLRKLGFGAFAGCSAIKEIDLDVCGNLEEFDKYVFSGCKSLENVFVPDSVTSIGVGSFHYCDKLKNVKLSTAITYVRSEMFENDPQLKTVYISKSVEGFGEEPFENCNALSDIYFGGTKAEWDAFEDHGGLEEMTVTIHFNSSEEEYIKKYNPKKKDRPGKDDDPTPSVSDDSVSYNSEIVFPGKKIPMESFGTITVSYDGAVYTATKIHVNKKKRKIQITKISPKDKKVQKSIKKMTKGKRGLDFTIKAYEVSNNSPVHAKVSKKGKITSVKIDLAGGSYKCKKKEYEYSSSSNMIVFKGDNLTGSYSLPNNSSVSRPSAN